MLSDYINWFLTSDEMDEYSAYFLQKQEMMNSLSFNKYSKIVLDRFKRNQDGADEFLSLASKFVSNSNFQEAFDRMTEQIKMPDISNMQVMRDETVQQELKTNADYFQKLVSQISDALIAITSSIGVMDTDSLLPSEEIDSALSKLYGSQNKKYDKIILSEDFKKSSAFFGQYKYLLSLIPDFQEVSKLNTADDSSITILSKILTPIQTLTGIVAEYQAEIELNKLIDSFKIDFKSKDLTIKRTGDESDKNRGKGFRTGTSDLSISLGSGNGSVSFQIPDIGVSLKQSRLKEKDNSYHIQLKKTTYGALFQEIDPLIITAFYNLYANTAPTIGGIQQQKIPNSTMVSAYNYMKSASLVTALIGGSNAEALTAIFVINNQPFTIFNLLYGLSQEGDMSKKIEMNPALSTRRKEIIKLHKDMFKPKSKDKEKRSREIRSAINSTPVKYSINLNAAMLKSLSSKL